jgi:hypothetical protein
VISCSYSVGFLAPSSVQNMECIEDSRDYKILKDERDKLTSALIQVLSRIVK